jgi:hypothetical protein
VELRHPADHEKVRCPMSAILCLAFLTPFAPASVIHPGEHLLAEQDALEKLEALPLQETSVAVIEMLPATNPEWGSATGFIDFEETDRQLGLVDEFLATLMPSEDSSPLAFVLRSPEMSAIEAAMRTAML